MIKLRDIEKILPKAKVAELKKALREDKERLKSRLGIPAKGIYQNSSRDRDTKAASSPQQMIFDALERSRPGLAQLEVRELVPHRNFVADIYLPASRLVIEMDGFQYHKNKKRFQADREKSNLLLEQGIPTLRYVYAQVVNNMDEIVGQILRIHDQRVCMASFQE